MDDDDLMALPTFPPGFLSKGLFCIRCGERHVTLQQVNCRQSRPGGTGTKWHRFTLNLCAPCVLEFFVQAGQIAD